MPTRLSAEITPDAMYLAVLPWSESPFSTVLWTVMPPYLEHVNECDKTQAPNRAL